MKNDVLIKADNFSITVFDLFMYLEPEAIKDTGELDWGSENRIREGLQQLYALNTLKLDAIEAQVMSEEEQAWRANYELTMKLVTRFLNQQVDAEAATIDWDSLALEYYIANQQEFMIPERLSLQTLLIRDDACDPEFAQRTAASILSEIEAGLDFEEAVIQYTQDDAARENKGLMSMVVRGQTVPEFEDAAFALASPGDLSPPVATQFGSHLIKLIAKTPAIQRPFEEVRQKIISTLETQEKGKILTTLRWEARERRPSGLEVDNERLQSFIAESSSS